MIINYLRDYKGIKFPYEGMSRFEFYRWYVKDYIRNRWIYSIERKLSRRGWLKDKSYKFSTPELQDAVAHLNRAFIKVVKNDSLPDRRPVRDLSQPQGPS